jgi:hypothetical protein
MKVTEENYVQVVTEFAPDKSKNLDWKEFNPLSLPGLEELNPPLPTVKHIEVEQVPQPELLTEYAVGIRVRFLSPGLGQNLLATITQIKPYSTSRVSQVIILRFDDELPTHLQEQPVTIPQNKSWLGKI